MRRFYDIVNVQGFSLTHDALAFLIKKKHKGAVHGVDFWVCHEVSAGSADPLGNAWVEEWRLDGEPPTVNEVSQLATDHGAEWQNILAARVLAEKMGLALQGTEEVAMVARKLEDLIQMLAAGGVSVPASGKTWADDRDTKRTTANR